MRVSSGLRINYVHDEADALAAAAAVAVNNGLEVPDFGLRQFMTDHENDERGNGEAAGWQGGGREPEAEGAAGSAERQAHLPEVRLERTRSGGEEDRAAREAGIFPPPTAMENASKLVETGHVSSMAASDLGRPASVLDAGALSKALRSNLQRTMSLPRRELGPPQQQESQLQTSSSLLGAFSGSHLVVAPPLANASQVPNHIEPGSLAPMRTHLSKFPPLQDSPLSAGIPNQDRGPVGHASNLGPSKTSVQPPPTGPPMEEVISSPSVAAAQALSFLNDEPDPNFQPQAVQPDWEAPPGAEGQETPEETAPPGEPYVPTGSEVSGSVHPSPNTPLTPWDAASTLERGTSAGDDVSRSAERKRKWDGEGQAGVEGLGDGPVSGRVSDVSWPAEEGGVEGAPAGGENGGARPVVHHSREISLVDGLFLDAVAEESNGRMLKKIESGPGGYEVGGSQ